MYCIVSCGDPEYVNDLKIKLGTSLILFLVKRNVLKKWKSKLKVGERVKGTRSEVNKNKEETKRSLKARSLGR
jgi:predicted CopG family antitoxin